MKQLTGIITALATPFKDGQFDKISFVRLIKWQMDQGVSAFVINGTTGESPCLLRQEVEEIFSCVRTETGNEISLILGVGGNCTLKTVENIKKAEKLKPDAVLSVVPYYNKPPQRGLLKHFKYLADHSELPVLLYNVPSRTITSLSIETIKELSQHPKIIGIKEASGDMAFDKELLKEVDKNFIVLSGDDDSFLDLCALGGQGVISVVSHILGKQIKQLFQAVKSGNSQALQEYKKKYSNLLKAIYAESNPIGIKMALKLLSVFDSAELRSPLVVLSEEKTNQLRVEMEKVGLL